MLKDIHLAELWTGRVRGKNGESCRTESQLIRQSLN
jgi:hypothetical protein